MAIPYVRRANDEAKALCEKVDAGTASAADLDAIREKKKIVYDVSRE